METLRELPNAKFSPKPISREAIARCIEVGVGDESLAQKVREDTSFDVAIVSSGIKDKMEVRLFKFEGVVPLFTTYCGDAIQKAMVQLHYDAGYEYPSAIRIK